jgi:hypothetical protein
MKITIQGSPTCRNRHPAITPLEVATAVVVAQACGLNVGADR